MYANVVAELAPEALAPPVAWLPPPLAPPLPATTAVLCQLTLNRIPGAGEPADAARSPSLTPADGELPPLPALPPLLLLPTPLPDVATTRMPTTSPFRTETRSPAGTGYVCTLPQPTAASPPAVTAPAPTLPVPPPLPPRPTSPALDRPPPQPKSQFRLRQSPICTRFRPTRVNLPSPPRRHTEGYTTHGTACAIVHDATSPSAGTAKAAPPHMMTSTQPWSSPAP